MDFKVVATGSEDPNVRDCVTLAEDLRAKGVQTRLDLWPGWQHDWPYWKEMMRNYV
jgi:esterase/lipase superfamily enzyme